MKLKRYFLFPLCTAIALIAVSAHAQADIDYAAIESLGIYDQANEKSLGTSLYQEANRSELIYFMNAIPSSSWGALDHIYNDLLLTSADANIINNDIPGSDLNNLLSVRLNVLIKRGLAAQANSLYSKLEDVSQSESIARAGVLSFLFSGKKALACLDEKTLFPHFKDIDFWKDLDLFCTYTHITDKAALAEVKEKAQSAVLKSIIESDTYKVTYAPEIFAELSEFDRAILTADKRILLDAEHMTSVSKLPPLDITSLLLQDNISIENKAKLLSASVVAGISTKDDIITFYTQILEDKENKSDIAALAKLYDETKDSFLGLKRDEKIAQAFTLSQQYGEALILPFSPVLAKMTIGNDLSLDNAYRAALILIQNNQILPAHWAKDLERLVNDKKNDNTKVYWLLLAVNSLHISKDEDLDNNINQALSMLINNNAHAAALKNIIENVDRTPVYSDKFRYVYENDFDSAWNTRYIMPPAILMDALRHSSENQNVGLSLLISAYILGQIDANVIHERNLSDITIALQKTGLETLSRNILAQAILEAGYKGD